MADPDVEAAGWATETPGSRVRRRRNPVLGLIALACLLGGVAITVVGIAGLVSETAVSDDEIVARGTVAGLGGPDTPNAQFTAPDDRSWTVYVDLDGVFSNNRDQIVAATACQVARSDGSSARFRGNRQGTALETGDLSTVGVFKASEGITVISCRQEPFGRRGRRGRLRTEREFVVVEGRPSERVRPFFFVFGGIALALLAWPLGTRWNAGRLRRVS